MKRKEKVIRKWEMRKEMKDGKLEMLKEKEILSKDKLHLSHYSVAF